MIKRKITYSEVIVIYEGKDTGYAYLVYGETSPSKEMRKILKDNKGEEIPIIKVITVTEKRAISLENFIKYSILINESEEM
jgi:hypothetical protein